MLRQVVDLLDFSATSRTKGFAAVATSPSFIAFVAKIVGHLPYGFDEPLHVLSRVEKVISK